ncbi:Interferon- developmental regulator 1 [Mortierella sp. 14UC]|nr:Interferon- developmental regulator 1 [Mortierella sp. 14UC]
MLYANKQPSSLRKSASKNSTRKLQQRLSGRGTHLSPAAAAGSSRHVSRTESHGNSDDDDDGDDDYGGGFDHCEGEHGTGREEGGRGGGGGGVKEGTVESRIVDAIEQLGERRSSTREEALTKLIAILSRHYVADLLDSRKEDLMDLLKKSIKRGGTRECVFAANAMVFVTAGEEDEQVLMDMAPLLKYTITNHDQPEVKAACLYTLATACYISSTPHPSRLPTYDLLQYLADLTAPKDASSSFTSPTAIHSDTLVAALESFGLLFAALFGKSTAGDDNYGDRYSGDDSGSGSRHEKDLQQARRLFNKMIPTIHYTLLEHPSVEVRVASGEVIGLMFEVLDHHERQRQRHEDEVGLNEHQQKMRRARETYQDDEEDDDWDDDRGGGGIAPTTGPFRYRDRQDLIGVLSNLARDSNRHRSKKDRSAGRSAFRDILKTVDLDHGDGIGGASREGKWPQETLKLKDYIVDFYGWVEILQLHYLRDRLTFGLQTHLFHNPMIHTLLPSTAVLYSPIESAFRNTATGTGQGNSGGGSGSRLGSRVGTRVGSRAGSQAGSRLPSSVGYYSDGGEDLAAVVQFYLQQQQLQQQANRLTFRKQQNAEVARLRQMQRKKERDGRGGKFFDELEY